MQKNNMGMIGNPMRIKLRVMGIRKCWKESTVNSEHIRLRFTDQLLDDCNTCMNIL